MKRKCGFLIHNEYKKTDDHPDYWGTVVLGGCEYNIGGWNAKTKKGRPKIDLRVRIRTRQTVQEKIEAAKEVVPMTPED